MGVGDPDSGWVEDPPSTLGSGVQHQPQRAERGDRRRAQQAQRQDDERLRAEAVALAADPNDVAEARRVIEDLEPLRAW